jgi:hypothetical protein
LENDLSRFARVKTDDALDNGTLSGPISPQKENDLPLMHS